MIPNWIAAFLSVFLVSIVSLIGIFTLSIKAKNLNKLLILFVSFSAGALFGDVFLHLLPHVVHEHGFSLSVSFSVLAGIVSMFAIEKIIHWRHCHHSVCEEDGEHTHELDEQHVHSFAIMNLIGDGVHNVIDGLIIGASYLVSMPVGIATTIAVVLHEIPQEIGDFGVLLHGGFSKKKALMFNFLTALGAFLGVVIALVLYKYVENIVFLLAPFAAGSFIYIAGSDLIPELHKESGGRKSIKQFILFVLGIAIMVPILFLE
jgi:zinc and cadmium transporter